MFRRSMQTFQSIFTPGGKKREKNLTRESPNRSQQVLVSTFPPPCVLARGDERVKNGYKKKETFLRDKWDSLPPGIFCFVFFVWKKVLEEVFFFAMTQTCVCDCSLALIKTGSRPILFFPLV